MFSLVLAVSLVYVAVIIALCVGANMQKEFECDATATQPQKFSVIIPFRNEAANLQSLLESLEELNYSKEHFEILLVDDASEDDSVAVIETFQKTLTLDISIPQNSEKSTAPKKQALQLGISKAKYDWIITTDADCIVPKSWLQSISNFINSEEPHMIVAPVFLKPLKRSALETIETLSLQMVAMGSFGLKKPLMNNGANLAFKKEVFLEVEGYSENTHIASGDDLFLMEKFLDRDYKVSYLKSKDATVLTNSQGSLAAFISQRVRWASKTSASNNTWLKVVGILVVLMNISVASSLILAIFQQLASRVFIWAFSLKFMADVFLVKQGIQFFEVKRLLGKLLFLSLVYPFLNTYIGIRSLFGGYYWKGRHFKR